MTPENVHYGMAQQIYEDRVKVLKRLLTDRVSTIMNADHIYVLSHGKIAEEGDYKGLMNKKGQFYQMVEGQSFE